MILRPVAPAGILAARSTEPRARPPMSTNLPDTIEGHVEGPVRNPRGRPSVMTEEVKEELLARMAEGRSILSICQDEDMPDKATVYRYLARKGPEYDEFRDRYSRAIVVRTYHLAEQTLQIAHDASEDWEEREREDGSRYMAVNPDTVARDKLRIWTNMWHIERLQGVKYGKPQQVAPSDDSLDDKGLVIQQIDYRNLPAEPPKAKAMPKFMKIDDDVDDIEIMEDK